MTDIHWYWLNRKQHMVLEYLQFNQRLLQLFICACYHGVWHLIPHDDRKCIEGVVNNPDGFWSKVPYPYQLSIDGAITITKHIHRIYTRSLPGPPLEKWRNNYQIWTQAKILESMAEQKWDKRWNTCTAAQIAQTIYDEQSALAVPILADALEDAGCDLPVREQKYWYRGNFILDKLLEKR